MVERMCRVHSFLNTIKGYSGSQIIVPEKWKLKDEITGEFVSIAGFWPVWQVLLLLLR
jgi:hypothetical protein